MNPILNIIQNTPESITLNIYSEGMESNAFIMIAVIERKINYIISKHEERTEKKIPFTKDDMKTAVTTIMTNLLLSHINTHFGNTVKMDIRYHQNEEPTLF